MIELFENEKPQLGERVFVHETACVIGRVTLGDNVSVWPMAVIRGDVNYVKIGNDSNIQDLSMLHVSHDGPYMPGGASLYIGERVTVGHKAMLHGCILNDEVLVGMGVTIMDHAVVESHTIIGAGSLVPMNKVISSGLWVGQPAKRVRELTDDEIKSIRYSAEHYKKLKERYLKG